jgi:hypothetical protein
LEIAALFEGLLATGVVDEYSAHGFGGRGKEMAAAVPMHFFRAVHHSQIRFVDERCSLQGLARLFVSEPLGG